MSIKISFKDSEAHTLYVSVDEWMNEWMRERKSKKERVWEFWQLTECKNMLWSAMHNCGNGLHKFGS